MAIYLRKTIGSEHTTPIPLNGKNVYLKFVKNYWKDQHAYFNTNDPELQRAIEESSYFKNGEITCDKKAEVDLKALEIAEKKAKKLKEPAALQAEPSTPETMEVEKAETTPETMEVEKAETGKTVENEEITNYQQAKSFLASEPYLIPKNALTTPERIMKKASELGISFPNLEL